MSILSPLFGEDFNIKQGYTYITRLLINDDICHSRIKITFSQDMIYPFEFFIRNVDENGKAIFGSPIFRELINYSNSDFMIVVPKLEKLLLIFGFDNTLLPEDIHKFNFDYKLEHLGLGNQIVTDMYMFETATGVPYQPHMVGSYSEFEFGEKIPWKGTSDYLGKRTVSRIVIGHEHENERGYVDRVYALPKRNKIHGSHSIKNKNIKDKEEHYIYLDPLQNTKQITSTSNNVIRGLMFQASDYPSTYGRITFRFFTHENDKMIYIRDEDTRNGVAIATCRAPITIDYKNIRYGLNSEFSTNPLILRLEQNETYKEGLFEYFPVVGNFSFYFKGRSVSNPTQMIEIPPNKIEEYNVSSLSYVADKIVIGVDDTGKKNAWYLINPNSNVTLYPKFDYDRQNFIMQSLEIIKHDFIYELLKNKFSVFAVTDKNNKDSLIEILQDETITGILYIDNVPDRIRFSNKYPRFIYKYDDNFIFPYEKIAELPNESITQILIKYKHITSTFEYYFISEETGHEFINLRNKYGPQSFHEFDISQIPMKVNDEFNYKYWGYEDVFNNQKQLGIPTENIYNESINGNEIYRYNFIYLLIKGYLQVKLIDENNNLLDLSMLKYNNNYIDNYNQIGLNRLIANQENVWTTELLPKITYNIMKRLDINENIYYETNMIYNEYTFLPTEDNEIDELIIPYIKNVVNPELQLTFTGSTAAGGPSNCSNRAGYRGVFINEDNVVIGTITTENNDVFSYNIDEDLFIGIELNTLESNNLKICVNIEDENRVHKEYRLYIWNTKDNSHNTCRGFDLTYISATNEIPRTYMNSAYPKSSNQYDIGNIFIDSTLNPVLIIRTGENTTSTVFDIRL